MWDSRSKPISFPATSARTSGGYVEAGGVLYDARACRIDIVPVEKMEVDLEEML